MLRKGLQDLSQWVILVGGLKCLWSWKEQGCKLSTPRNPEGVQSRVGVLPQTWPCCTDTGAPSALGTGTLRSTIPLKGRSFTQHSSGKTIQDKAFMPSLTMRRELLVPLGVITVRGKKVLKHKISRMGLVLLFSTGRHGLIKSCSWLEEKLN